MNNFTFNGGNYLQVGGTAMGTRLAPSYANLFMGQLEEKFLKNAPYKPKLYLRYIDDIFLIFTGSQSELDEFINFMKHRTIKFTAEYSKEKVCFLDTWVIKNRENRLYTNLFTKPTDTHNYLHYTSSHPTHSKNGGPYGEFLRIRRNCNLTDDYEINAQKRTEDYLRRGYPRKLLNESKAKALNQNRTTLLNKAGTQNTKEKSKRVPLVVTYNPANPNFLKIIKKHWPLLSLSDKCREAFTKLPVIAYRRNKNLNYKLVSSKVKQLTPADTPATQNLTPTNRPTYMCTNKQFHCDICPKKDLPLEYTSTFTGRSYPGILPYKCGVRNVVYLITCRKCRKQYIGQTYRTYRERITEHFGYIRRKKMDTATGKHFNLPGHTKFDLNHRVVAILRGECIYK